jgi:hypothetical protein
MDKIAWPSHTVMTGPVENPKMPARSANCDDIKRVPRPVVAKAALVVPTSSAPDVRA